MKAKDRAKEDHDLSEEQICFLISPIGKKGTDIHEKFKNVLEYVIKPAVKNSGYKVRVLRADDVNRAGSFIKDILELLLNSFIVIADLTDQNPNVFYELGVRHALSTRTILIAQDEKYIPSDLKEYRTIIYEDSAKGTSVFKDKLSLFFEEIYDKPDRPDNPVIDRLGNLFESKSAFYEKEIRALKEELTQDNIKDKKPENKGVESVKTRLSRIFRILKINPEYQGEIIFDHEDNKKKTVTIKLPLSEGEFVFYTQLDVDQNFFTEYFYIATMDKNLSLDNYMADVRMLLEVIKKILKYEDDAKIRFIIATNNDLEKYKSDTNVKFSEMKKIAGLKAKHSVILELWDNKELSIKEKELGIYV